MAEITVEIETEKHNEACNKGMDCLSRQLYFKHIPLECPYIRRSTTPCVSCTSHVH